ncbi:MAG: tetratricopeptide repeat protein, partial [Calothrix sp. SM1_7_51]|nr:tetratricopeptide repeat protein [Calothrix sp. SM1_7_51]
MTVFLTFFLPIAETELVIARVIATENIQDPSVLVELGKKYYENNRYSEAVEVWEQAVKGFQAQGNLRNQALALSNLSLTYQQVGNWSGAEKAITDSLNILLSLKENSDERSQIYVQALDIKGHLKYAVGKTLEALNIWKEAAKFYAQINDKEGSAINKLNQAQALQTLGSFRQAKESLIELEKSLKNQPDTAFKAKLFRSISHVYAVMGELEITDRNKEENAQYALNRSLEVAKNLTSPDKEKEESATLLSLGNNQRALAKRFRERRESTGYVEFQECKKYGVEANTPEFNSEQEEEEEDEEDETFKLNLGFEKQRVRDALNYYKQATNTAINISTLTQSQAEINQLSLLIEFNSESEAQELWQKIQNENLLSKLTPRASIYAGVNLAKTLSCFNSSVYDDESKKLLENASQQADKNRRHAEGLSYAQGNLGR